MSTSIRDTKRSSCRVAYKAGDVIDGKYELVSKAGKGSMGEVWVATHLALRSSVAIKIINPEVLLPVIAERLLREARAAATVNHPSIVRVFDLGETPAAGPFIVMELLEGESLRQRLDRDGPLKPEEAVALLLPIASAMQAAHGHGIIHRDLKPDNIMLARTDTGATRPKLVDFGIAKLAWTEPDGTGAMMIGTPDYMSPEQARGGDSLDHRTDLWSFCVLLYEVLAGETPFSGETTWEVLRTIVEEPATSLAECAVTDAALWTILERGLSKDPSARWSSMRELGDALARWLASRGVAEDACGASLRVEWLENGSPDHVKTRTGQNPAAKPNVRALTMPGAPRDTGSGRERRGSDDLTSVKRMRGTVVQESNGRGRRLAVASALLAAVAVVGVFAVSHLDPRLGLLSSTAQRAQPLPALPSPPAPMVQAADVAPSPPALAAAPVQREEPTAAPSATPSASSLRMADTGARPVPASARGLVRPFVPSHPERGPATAVTDAPKAAPAAGSAPEAPKAAPPAASTAALTATPSSPAPGVLPVMDPTSPL
jgi:serine/threonine protein kinase